MFISVVQVFVCCKGLDHCVSVIGLYGLLQGVGLVCVSIVGGLNLLQEVGPVCVPHCFGDLVCYKGLDQCVLLF